MHRLGEAAGVLPGEVVAPALRPVLKQAAVDAGQFALFMPALLKPKAANMRAMLWALWHNADTPELPAAGLVSATPPRGWEEKNLALQMGWVIAGPVMIRLDIAEKLARELNYLIRKHPVALPGGLGSRLSLKPEQLPAALNTLGFRIIPAAALAADRYGPPAPPMLVRRKGNATRQPVRAEIPPPLPGNPFAALAGLKRAAS